MTYAGMSGGLVGDKDRRFAGLLLGRMPDPNPIPLMITARQVKEVLDAAADKWAPCAGTPLSAEPTPGIVTVRKWFSRADGIFCATSKIILRKSGWAREGRVHGRNNG